MVIPFFEVTHEFLIYAAVAILIIGLITIYRLAHFRRYRAGITLRHFWPVIVGTFLISFCCIILVYANEIMQNGSESHSKSLLPSILASLIEDIAFFSALGLVVILVQHRDFLKHRSFEERVRMLFDKEDISSEELTEIKDRIREISCDYRQMESTVDVRQYDSDIECIQLDVARTFFMSNYVSGESADVKWKVGIKPDDVRPKSALLEIYPSRARTVWRNRGGVLATDGFVELHPAALHYEPTLYANEPVVPRVPAGKALEIQSRYRVWQPLRQRDGFPQPLRFGAQKHWDCCLITVRNSLERSIRVKLSGAALGDMELAPGETSNPLKIDNFFKSAYVEMIFDMYIERT